MIGTAFNGLISLLLAKFILNDIPHSLKLSGNPGSPQIEEIIYRAGLKEFEPTFFPIVAEERPSRVFPYTRTRNVSVYTIYMTGTDGSCTIKLYENLPGWKRKLRATWSGIGKVECNRKFEEISETIRQVIYEYKTSLMRR